MLNVMSELTPRFFDLTAFIWVTVDAFHSIRKFQFEFPETSSAYWNIIFRHFRKFLPGTSVPFDFPTLVFEMFCWMLLFAGIQRKFPYLLSPFRNFRNFWLNGTRLMFPYVFVFFLFPGLKSWHRWRCCISYQWVLQTRRSQKKTMEIWYQLRSWDIIFRSCQIRCDVGGRDKMDSAWWAIRWEWSEAPCERSNHSWRRG